MSHSPSMFDSCVALNNQGVRKFVKEQNLEEACLLFRRALCVVKKQRADWVQSNLSSDSAKASRQGRVAKASAPLARAVEERRGARQCMDEGYLTQISGQEHFVEDCQEGAVQGSENKREGPPLHKTWNSTSTASPVRLGTSYTARNAPDPLQWRLTTTVIAFNLALTYSILGFTVSSPQEAPKRWKAALALFELACKLRVAVVTKKNFKGDMLAALDVLIVQNTLNLHIQLNSFPSESSSVRKLESYVQLVQASLNNHKKH